MSLILISLPFSDSLPPGSSMLFSLFCNLVPCQLLWLCGFRTEWFKSTKFWIVQKCQFCLGTLDRKAPDTEALTQFSASSKGREKLVSWAFSKCFGLGSNSPFRIYLLTRPPDFHCAGVGQSERQRKLLYLNPGLEAKNQMH